MIIKAIFEKFHVAVPLCPSVFKYFLEQQPTLHDLEAYDPAIAAQMRYLLHMDDSSNVGIDFSDVLDGEAGNKTLDNNNREVSVVHCILSMGMNALYQFDGV